MTSTVWRPCSAPVCSGSWCWAWAPRCGCAFALNLAFCSIAYVRLDGKMSALYQALSAKVASVSKLAASSGTSSLDLMQATQQMQQMQMSFNLQFLELQEQIQNDSREYTMLSNVLKTRYDTMKGILANIK